MRWAASHESEARTSTHSSFERGEKEFLNCARFVTHHLVFRSRSIQPKRPLSFYFCRVSAARTINNSKEARRQYNTRTISKENESKLFSLSIFSLQSGIIIAARLPRKKTPSWNCATHELRGGRGREQRGKGKEHGNKKDKVHSTNIFNEHDTECSCVNIAQCVRMHI